MTYNKFTTLTSGEEEQEFDDVLASIVPGAVKTFNLPGRANSLFGRLAVATVHEGRNSQRHGHESSTL